MGRSDDATCTKSAVNASVLVWFYNEEATLRFEAWEVVNDPARTKSPITQEVL
eukprot:m.185085 g.185085  ORF g.185085 m.185085 type:complete len:53 (-) comp14725_c2_seq10:2136-2294(-)